MTTVLDMCTIEEQRAVVRILWVKGHVAMEGNVSSVKDKRLTRHVM